MVLDEGHTGNGEEGLGQLERERTETGAWNGEIDPWTVDTPAINLATSSMGRP